MKKAELKKILKPLIKECIKETIFEDGLLSGIISEVAHGMNSVHIEQTPKAEPKPDPVMERMKRNAFNEEQSAKLQSHKRKLMEAIGSSAYNGVDLFGGTTAAPAQKSAEGMSSPLSNQEPTDPGVDISGLFGSVRRNWNAHMNEIKERK